MPAPRYDITIERGVTWTLPVTWTNPNGTPVDMTGYAVKAELRRGNPESPGAEVFEFSTANGRITLNGPAGTFTLALTPAESRTFAVADVLCYDVRGYSPTGQERRFFFGSVTVVEEVTQP